MNKDKKKLMSEMSSKMFSCDVKCNGNRKQKYSGTSKLYINTPLSKSDEVCDNKKTAVTGTLGCCFPLVQGKTTLGVYMN